LCFRRENSPKTWHPHGCQFWINFFENFQRSGCTDALAQAAPCPAQALKRQKGEKKRPDTRVSASIRSNEITTIQFYITVILASLAGNFLILALCQGCHFLLPHDFICPADCEIPGFKKHGIQKIVLIIVQKGMPASLTSSWPMSALKSRAIQMATICRRDIRSAHHFLHAARLTPRRIASSICVMPFSSRIS